MFDKLRLLCRALWQEVEVLGWAGLELSGGAGRLHQNLGSLLPYWVLLGTSLLSELHFPHL